MRGIGLLILLCVLAGLYNGWVSTPSVLPAAPAPSISSLTVAAPARTIPAPKLQLISWEKGGFGTVAIVDLKLTNSSAESWVRDIGVMCTFQGKSGTVINSQTATVYDTIKPMQDLTVRKLSMGFVDKQATSATCVAVKADACCGFTTRFIP